MSVTITGSNDRDKLYDLAGHTIIECLDGHDVIYAHADDIFHAPKPGGGTVATYGVDIFDGDEGYDTVDYRNATTSIRADLAAGTAVRLINGFEYAPDTLISIELLRGSDHDDWLAGNELGNSIMGGHGDDTVHGRGGRDHLQGLFGDDRIFGGQGDDDLYGDDGEDLLEGGSGDDRLFGGDGNDELNGGTGDDTLEGRDGNDILNPGIGVDTVNGGKGTDRLVLDSFLDVRVDLTNGSASGHLIDATLIGIENVTVAGGNDSVVGNSRANALTTGGGDDIVVSAGGDDAIGAGGGDDRVYAGDDDDTVFGSSGNDQIFGEDGDDDLLGGSDRDWIFGGNDFNRIWTGSGPDVIGYEVGAVGFDRVKDFALGQDRFHFEQGVLKQAKNLDLPDLLQAIAVLGAEQDSFVQANLAGKGWTTVARLENVAFEDINDAIADGNFVYDAQVDYDPPGGFDF